MPTSKWYILKKVLCHQIGILPKEGAPAFRQLSNFLSVLQKGGFGDKRRGTFVSIGISPTDLFNEVENELNAHTVVFGKKESFTNDLLLRQEAVMQSPRFLSFGGDTIRIRIQTAVAKHIFGVAAELDKNTAERRQANWQKWFRKSSSPVQRRF